jgi:hypothetical protein
MKVYLDDPNSKGSRIIVEAELIKQNKQTVWVKLLDGNIIKRKKSRDIPNIEESNR